MSETTLLLTATIDPRDCVNVARRDPTVRLADYAASLRKWVRQPHITNIVFCENSGWPLDDLMNAVEWEGASPGRVTFISFTAEEAGARGKGWGEMEIIEKAVSAMNVTDRARIVTVSGRYYVRNIAAIAACIDTHDADIMTCGFLIPYSISDDRVVGPSIASDCYVGTATFLRDFLCAKREQVNDADGHFFEEALALAVTEAVERGLRHIVFPETPEMEGISGGFGVQWQSTFMATAPILNADGTIEVRNRRQLKACAALLRGYVALAGSRGELPESEGAALSTLADTLRRAADEPVVFRLEPRDGARLVACARRCLEIATPSEFHKATGLRPGFPSMVIGSLSTGHAPGVHRSRPSSVRSA